MTDKKKEKSKLILSRRQFLRGAGVLALAGAAAGITDFGLTRGQAVKAADDTSNLADHQWVMVFDLRLCDGCAECTKACQKEHYARKDQTFIKVYQMTGPLGQTYFQPTPCMQCENAPCVRACPVRATYKTPDGTTLIDQEKCIGCRMCMAACPYGARYFNWEDSLPVPSTLPKPVPEFNVPARKGTVSKCEFCLHDSRVGRLPSCVTACQMRALWYGDLVSDIMVNPDNTVKLSTFLKENDAYRLKEDLNTEPHVYYVAGHGQNYQY